MNIFQGSIHRLSGTIKVWSVEGGAMLMGHPVYEYDPEFRLLVLDSNSLISTKVNLTIQITNK